MAIHSSILCLENPMDRGACGSVVHRVTDSDTPVVAEYACITVSYVNKIFKRKDLPIIIP